VSVLAGTRELEIHQAVATEADFALGLMGKSVEMDFGKPCENCPGTTPCFV
tara:strand:- start:256 stop:408 length:153 start_codon:yes stop_codon:yes gene_type:complete